MEESILRFDGESGKCNVFGICELWADASGMRRWRVSANPVMHAHRCEKCAENGKQVVWIHSETDRGVVAAHKCPECGEVQWKKWLVEPARLPQSQHVQSGVSFETILGYVLIFTAFAMLGYGMYLYVKDRRTLKVLPE